MYLVLFVFCQDLFEKDLEIMQCYIPFQYSRLKSCSLFFWPLIPHPETNVKEERFLAFKLIQFGISYFITLPNTKTKENTNHTKVKLSHVHTIIKYFTCAVM